MGVHLKKIGDGFPVFFVIPNLTKRPSSPAARESISAAIPFNLLGKKGTMMQNADVGHGKSKMDKM
jgi:hypothetical protein